MDFQKAIDPKIGMIVTTIVVALLTLGARQMLPFALIVIGAAIVGFGGCFVATLPPAEYMIATAVSVAIAMVIEFDPWILVIPGLVTGYIWGNVVADYLTKRNLDLLRDKPKGPKKYTSF